MTLYVLFQLLLQNPAECHGDVCCCHGLDTRLLLAELHHKCWGFVNILHCPINIFLLLLNLRS
jgi:hypothetical protein